MFPNENFQMIKTTLKKSLVTSLHAKNDADREHAPESVFKLLGVSKNHKDVFIKGDIRLCVLQ